MSPQPVPRASAREPRGVLRDSRRRTPLRLGPLTMGILALALVASSPGRAAKPPEVAGPDDRFVLKTEAACAEVSLSTYRLRIVGPDGEPLFTSEEVGGGVFYERRGSVHHLTRVRELEKSAQAATLTVDTDEGTPATVTLRWLTPRTLEVTVQPTTPATLTAL